MLYQGGCDVFHTPFSYGFGGFILPFLHILFIGVVIYTVLALLRRHSGGGRHACHCGLGNGNGSSAHEVLKERYARGELDKAQFESMKKDLEA
jgi:putative membrane protein